MCCAPLTLKHACVSSCVCLTPCPSRAPSCRLITVNTIKVPEGVDWAALVKNAMDKFNLEIAGGLGPTAGKVWRVSRQGTDKQAHTVA